MYFLLVRAAVFVLTAIVIPPVAMGRLSNHNNEGNEINDIFQSMPEVSLNYFSLYLIISHLLDTHSLELKKKTILNGNLKGC